MDDVSQSVAWRYHEATNHSVESLRRHRHGLDWANQPRPYKRYAQPMEPVPLPRETLSSGKPALEAILPPRPRIPRSARNDKGFPAMPRGEGTLDAALLSTLLQLSAGITKWLRFPQGDMAFRAAACTGALYHVDLYVVCSELPDVPAGVYHFDVEQVALTRLRAGDFRAVLVEATAGDDRIRHAPAIIVATSTWWRNSWKYQARTYRHSFWDSGTILANLLAVASSHDLPAGMLVGFADGMVNALLDLDPDREAALELAPLGYDASEPPPAPPVRRLHLPVQPYSFSEVDEPLIRQVHQATSLAGPEEVSAWRQACHPEEPGGTKASPQVPSPSPSPAAAGEGIESVIRRRGSARQFERTPIGLDALEAMLAAAGGESPSDWGARISDMHLIVNAVEGLDGGAYVVNRGRTLQPLMLGEYRDIAGRLDLGQDLAADAAVNVYFLADLREVLGRCGQRGYRAAQLDASLAAGKLYLAAYATGVAATGLTFFDDEVVDFFSPHAAGKSVMFLLAIGNRAKRR